MSTTENNFVDISTVGAFNFTFSENASVTHYVTLPVAPNFCIRELAFRICHENKIPYSQEDSLISALKTFIDEKTELIETENNSKVEMEDSKKSKLVERVNALKLGYNIFPDSPTLVNVEDTKFSEMYHDLIHSGFLTKCIVSLEQCYSLAISDLVLARNEAVENLTSIHTTEMEKLIREVGVTTTDVDVNIMSAKHFREVENLQSKWEDDIICLKAFQKRTFRELIEQAYLSYCNGEKESIMKCFQKKIEDTLNEYGKNVDSFRDWETLEMNTLSNMEESFTINLGSQLKTTHNLRLISRNVLELCHDHNRFEINPSPQKIQTSMSLYSDCLSALILLVDNRVNSYSGIKKDFARACSQATDFHFSSLEEQHRNIREILNCRSRSVKGLDASQSVLKPGDFYVTKHSNLSQVHIVFHLVCDDSVSLSSLNSRHPVILGLRNILKLAHINDINVLSLPLLLIHEMSENITLQWCLKRAELVLKCVKGFMIEMASLLPSTEDNKTLQFIVPKGISEELFTNLTSMLSGIFRLSNPLVLKTNGTLFTNN
ncbi:hypothetical protein B4U80_05075 [Leptotrombidium deliense]|uniref:Uncharacterized protein n=1 Tax=Leptotrombidium deliense TaxID=299467 RepID=A0A443ST21_9ACAR|nr:hypothetical protein B4U80_05075 [Leptotrombidium deliense]